MELKVTGQKISGDTEIHKKPHEALPTIVEQHKAEPPAASKSKKSTTINATIADNKQKYEQSLIKAPEPQNKEPAPPTEYYFTNSQPKQFQETKMFESTSEYVNYVPSDNIKELKLEKLWFTIKNRELCMKREQEELNKVMEQWGKSKSKYDEEVMRKMESLNEATSFAQRSYPVPSNLPKVNGSLNYQQLYEQESESDDNSDEEVTHHAKITNQISPQKEAETVTLTDPIKIEKKAPKPKAAPQKKAAAVRGKKQEAPKAEPQKPVEFIDIPDSKKMGDDAIKQNIKFIRNLYGPIIDATDNKMADTESIYKDSYTTKPICLSLYNKDAMKDRPRTTGPCRTAQETFPNILTNVRNDYVAKQYRDIEHLKETFAKAEIPCSVITLQNALLMPQPLQPGRMTADCVPEPGSRLMSNPFIKKKKKGKKKGGKKGGKKKKM